MFRRGYSDISIRKDFQGYQEESENLIKSRNSALISTSQLQKSYQTLKQKRCLKLFQQVEKTKLLRRENYEKDKELQWREEIWNQREMDFKKSIRRVTLHCKRDEIETLILIMLLFFLFLFALYMAPNQFYCEKNNI